MQRFFSILLFLLRLVFGTVFVISGVLKLVDPVGTSLIFAEYLNVFFLSFLKPAVGVFGVLLSVLEIMVGMAVLMRIRMKLSSLVAMLLTVFFTIVTYILFKFSPIPDCGCFGEAVHLTNTQTFVKNLILLLCIIPVYLKRNDFQPVTEGSGDLIFLGCHALLAFVLSIWSAATLPMTDFGDFRPGTNIRNMMEQIWSGESDDVFVYEKDGERRGFPLTEIPDSTWHFVEKLSEESDSLSSAFDFAVADLTGEYITDSILNHSGPVVLFSVHDPDLMDDSEWKEIIDDAEVLDSAGIMTRLLVSETERGFDTLSPLFGVCDYKTLISLSRSNGGAVLLNSGVVVDKFYAGECDESELVSIVAEDPDEMISNACIRGHILLELVFLFQLMSMLIFRYLCGLKRDMSAEEKV